MRLIDSHAHLQADTFEGDAAEVLAAARLAGVERVLVPGWDLASSRRAIAMAARTGVDASAGVHPHVSAEVHEGAWAAIAEAALDPSVVAVGETGLDYDRAFASRETQLSNLRRHLVLGRDIAKPLILHCRSKPGERDAQDDLIEEIRAAGTPRAVLHSFSGPVDYGEVALELGLAISFSGLVFRRGEESSAEVARLVPAERLLVETDSPYLSPPGAPRRRNEPLWVAVTARWLATQRTEDPEEVGERLVSAYDDLFRSARNLSTPSDPARR